MFDSQGFIYELDVAEFKKNKGFSLLYLKRMIEVKPILKKPPSQINLEDLKLKTMNQVKLKPKFWLSLDTIEGIQDMVDKARTYTE